MTSVEEYPVMDTSRFKEVFRLVSNKKVPTASAVAPVISSPSDISLQVAPATAVESLDDNTTPCIVLALIAINGEINEISIVTYCFITNEVIGSEVNLQCAAAVYK